MVRKYRLNHIIQRLGKEAKARPTATLKELSLPRTLARTHSRTHSRAYPRAHSRTRSRAHPRTRSRILVLTYARIHSRTCSRTHFTQCQPAFGKDQTKSMDVKNMREYMGWLYYQYLLITGIYVLEPWEKSIFNTVLFTMVAMVVYTSYVFVPIHVRLALEFFSGLCGEQPESTVALMS
ncbi:serine palmitoyltransferase small subunit B [Silurus meridionalis]|uniref:Serine palmitoyltransferase small subunit B n=1 Tax=Silurus meridionalis TaxID=175797 RepID=A0A8T0AJF2_SILME|nr:hypothetical protein HF521_010368 [Silurus meridionalis]KAI5093038.1 serine palmitoyltransferase small subunit B [Silurus meridionalis]